MHLQQQMALPMRATPDSQFDRTVSRYNLGDIVDQFKREEAYYELSGGLSSGLVDGWTRRAYAACDTIATCSALRRSIASRGVGLGVYAELAQRLFCKNNLLG
jgi:hypothetical protein